jgi:hypothetical protein
MGENNYGALPSVDSKDLKQGQLMSCNNNLGH